MFTTQLATYNIMLLYIVQPSPDGRTQYNKIHGLRADTRRGGLSRNIRAPAYIYTHADIPREHFSVSTVHSLVKYFTVFPESLQSYNIILSANGTIVFMSHCFYVFIRGLLSPTLFRQHHVGTKICDAIYSVMGFCRLMTERPQYNNIIWLLHALYLQCHRLLQCVYQKNITTLYTFATLAVYICTPKTSVDYYYSWLSTRQTFKKQSARRLHLLVQKRKKTFCNTFYESISVLIIQWI